MTLDPLLGRSLVARRALRDIVRGATLSVYGVSGFAGGGPVGRVLRRLGVAERGLRLRLDGSFLVELHLAVAPGLPVAEVARQVEASVRYALRQAVAREPDRVAIRIRKLSAERGTGSRAPGRASAHSGAAVTTASAGRSVPAAGPAADPADGTAARVTDSA